MAGEEFGSTERKNVLMAVVALMFFVLVGRLYQLQYIYREEYDRKSEENSVRQVVKQPIRGYIFDRKGKIFVDNRPSYTVMLTPVDFNQQNIPLLANLLHVTPEMVTERIKKAKTFSMFAPARLKRDIDFPTLSRLEEHRSQLSGIEVQVESKRYYGSGAVASHMLGYAKEISESQLEKFGDYYQLGDVVGAAGIEANYEENLRGEKGYEFISQNSRGQTIGAFNEGRNDIPPQDGSNLYLALDRDVQVLAESLMAEKRGAVVAIDPNNGGIIAMVSKPDYDLSYFSGVTPPEIWKALNSDESKPLFNRASLTRYPPGSTFKMVVAAAALESNIIDENWRVQCRGSFVYGNKVFKDLHVHGSTNVIEALQKSCNVFFYQLMLKVGLDRWHQIGAEFGFGQPTRIDILEENAGLLPSIGYYDRVYGKGRWTQGYLVSLGIGQGEVGVSPVQMAVYAAMLGNKGIHYQPHIVERIYNPWTKQGDTIKPVSRQMQLSERTWNLVREGMRRVVMSPGGTGAGARIPGIEVAGKTGTAENPHGKAHAWFIGFAPFDEPKIAICVLVENVGYGGSFAAPIAGLCMEQYLYGEIIRNQLRPKISVQHPIKTSDRDSSTISMVNP